MPIKFRCPVCDQALGIARRKAGTFVHCPKCQAAIEVPNVEASAAGQPGDEPDSAHRLFEHEEFDRWLEKPAREDGAPNSVAASELSRFQQLLMHWSMAMIAACALLLVAFGSGLLVGRYVWPSQDGAWSVASVETMEGPAEIRGYVQYRQGEEVFADDGASIILLPATVEPDQRIGVIGLKPGDRFRTNRPGVVDLTRIGGAMSFADKTGLFRVKTPRPGAFYVLAISNKQRRVSDKPISPGEREVLERYFVDEQIPVLLEAYGEDAAFLILPPVPLEVDAPRQMPSNIVF